MTAQEFKKKLETLLQEGYDEGFRIIDSADYENEGLDDDLQVNTPGIDCNLWIQEL